MSCKDEDHNHLPSIPVLMRHSFASAYVKQYRSEAQNEQLQQHIVSESFVPMIPQQPKPPRKRRRPPFSYSSLIAQAILESKDQRMTLRDIYHWIMSKYPALYNAQDTGWQNTIRHNLSHNQCFQKVPKNEWSKGKGGYWKVDPNRADEFEPLLKKPESSSPTYPDTPTSMTRDPCHVMQIQNLL
ncbi:fork head domain-containing protein, partial [Sporodiniella umbellata]